MGMALIFQPWMGGGHAERFLYLKIIFGQKREGMKIFFFIKGRIIVDERGGERRFSRG